MNVKSINPSRENILELSGKNELHRHWSCSFEQPVFCRNQTDLVQYHRSHRMEEYNIQELKARLIFLFRLLKVDTIFSYDPWGTYEENPDHYVTAKAVEAACWEAGSLDYPEQLEVVQPYAVKEK